MGRRIGSSKEVQLPKTRLVGLSPKSCCAGLEQASPTSQSKLQWHLWSMMYLGGQNPSTSNHSWKETNWVKWCGSNTNTSLLIHLSITAVDVSATLKKLEIKPEKLQRITFYGNLSSSPPCLKTTLQPRNEENAATTGHIHNKYCATIQPFSITKPLWRIFSEVLHEKMFCHLRTYHGLDAITILRKFPVKSMWLDSMAPPKHLEFATSLISPLGLLAKMPSIQTPSKECSSSI